MLEIDLGLLCLNDIIPIYKVGTSRAKSIRRLITPRNALPIIMENNKTPKQMAIPIAPRVSAITPTFCLYIGLK